MNFRQITRLLMPCSLLFSTAILAAPAKTRLELHVRAGAAVVDVSKVNMKMAMAGKMIPFEMVSKDKITVSKVAANGDVTEVDKSLSQQLVMMGKVHPVPASGGNQVTVLDMHSAVKSLTMSGSPLEIHDQVRLTEATDAWYPSFPVGVGSVWTHLQASNATLGEVKSKGVYKITGIQLVNHVACYTIVMHYTELAGQHPISTSGTIWVSKKSGDTVKFDSNFKNVPVPGSGLVTAHVIGLRVSGSLSK